MPVRRMGSYSPTYGNRYIGIGTAECVILHLTLVNGKQVDYVFAMFRGKYSILSRNINNIKYLMNYDFENGSARQVSLELKDWLEKYL